MPDECCICLDEIVVATTGCVQLACSHTYHLGCISTWFQKNPSCPECRSAPTEKEAPSALSAPITDSFSSFITSYMNRDWVDRPDIYVFDNMSRGASVPRAPLTPEQTRDNDARLVSTQTSVTLDVARGALERCNGDIVTAILDIVQESELTFDIPETFELSNTSEDATTISLGAEAGSS